MLVERITYGIDVGLVLFMMFVRCSVIYLCYYVIFVMDVPYIYAVLNVWIVYMLYL